MTCRGTVEEGLWFVVDETSRRRCGQCCRVIVAGGLGFGLGRSRCVERPIGAWGFHPLFGGVLETLT